MRAVIGIEAYDVPEVFEVNKRQQKTVNIKATAEAVAGVTLDITIGVNPDLVAVYNEAHGTSYEMLPGEAFSFVEQQVLMPRFNKLSSLAQINLIGQGCVENQIYVLPVVIEKVTGTDNYELSVENSVTYFLFKMLPALKGTGTVDDPYLIQELNDFLTMGEKMLSGDKVYFVMEADIDMAGVENFTHLNPKPYDQEVIFDGRGHKIMNYSCPNGIFHVLNGSVENLVFENANVAGAANTGILAHYIGYTDIDAHVKNITFRDSKFSGKADSGMLSGYTYNALVENIYFDNCEIVLNGRRQGFVTGRSEDYTEFKNCYAKGGKCSGGTQQCGGLIGQINAKDAKVTNCGISADISGNRAMGGIIAYVKGPAGSTTVENCIAWSSSIQAISDPGNSYSSGAIIGCSDQGVVTFRNCYYRPDMNFKDRSEAMGVLHDTPDVIDGPAPTTTTNATTYKNAFAWHGKAAAAGKTASQVAKDLKWDETIWDLSGAEPRLK